jgi:hypothetical protein
MTTPVRLASSHLNYPGDCTRSIEARIESMVPMGPNYLGELMWPVFAEYDAETKTTRVGFTLAPPPALVERMAASQAGAEA